MNIINKLIWLPVCIVCIFLGIIGNSVFKHNLYFMIAGSLGLLLTLILMNTILDYKNLKDCEFIKLMNILKSQTKENNHG